MKLFLSICFSMLLTLLAIGLWRMEVNKLDKCEKQDVAGLRSDLQTLHGDINSLQTIEAANNVAVSKDVLDLKTDYAEFNNFRVSLNSYETTRKDIGAFRELDEAVGKLFMGLITKEQELDSRLKKIEKCRK